MREFFGKVGLFLGGLAAIVVLIVTYRDRQDQARRIAATLVPTRVTEESVEEWHEKYMQKVAEVEQTLEAETAQGVKLKWKKAFGGGG